MTVESNRIPDDYRIPSDDPAILTCIKCGTQDKLSFTMFRNNGRLVGFLCACADCQDEVAGGTVAFSWLEESKIQGAILEEAILIIADAAKSLHWQSLEDFLIKIGRPSS